MAVLFRENASHGEWCAVILPIAFLVSRTVNFYDSYKMSILLASIGMSFYSYFLAYQIIYKAVKKESGSICRHFLQCFVSDLFERQVSILARKTRKISRSAQNNLDSIPKTIEEARRLRLLSSAAMQTSHLATAPSRYRKLSLQQPARESKDPRQRKLSLNEKLSASPESKLIDNQIDETYMVNTKNYVPGICEALLLILHFGTTWLISGNVKVSLLLCSALAAFVYCLPKLFLTFKRSFTYGEGCLVLQSVSLYAGHAICQILTKQASDTESMSFALTTASRVISLGTGFTCLVTSAAQLRWVYSSWIIFITASTFFLSIIVTLINRYLAENFLLQLLIYSGDNPQRIAMCVLYIASWLYSNSSRFSPDVNLSEGLLTIFFLAGTFIDQDFLYFLSTLAVAGLIHLENFRFQTSRTKGISNAPIICLRKIYFVSGLSLSTWMSCCNPKMSTTSELLVSLSGILSIGVGKLSTTLAQFVGKKTKFPDSEKFVEGAMFSILAQLMTLWILDKMNLLIIVKQGSNILLITAGLAILEAMNTQNDFLILPFLSYFLYSWEL